ncbi:unnamed protein product [marine sediment metagenome]|uniref:RNA polymerase sigma-70 region 2 domain-containing protein n=1 Tax=marine sediment metagenome TaxID=412755 RepID=X0WCH4_9ZZZZ
MAHYVVNKELLAEVIQFKEDGFMSEELGNMITMIAQNLANKGNFAGYTWKRDMIGEAVLTCVKYLKNFNPEKSTNPFAYITTICRNAFINYIRKQKRHSYIKDNCYKNLDPFMEHHNENFVCRGINYELLAPVEKVKDTDM